MTQLSNLTLAGNRAKYERIAFTLAPGESVEKNITGEFIYCVESNIGFEFALNEDRPIESDIGIEYRQEPGEVFTKVRLKNTDSTITLSCAFLYGYGKIEDRRLVPVAGRRVGILIEEFPTQYLGSGETSLAATSSITFDGIPTGTQRSRKEIVITNLEPLGGNNLQINDSSGNQGRVILPQSTISIVTTDEVEIENTTGSAIALRVDELWYTNG